MYTTKAEIGVHVYLDCTRPSFALHCHALRSEKWFLATTMLLFDLLSFFYCLTCKLPSLIGWARDFYTLLAIAPSLLFRIYSAGRDNCHVCIKCVLPRFCNQSREDHDYRLHASLFPPCNENSMQLTTHTQQPIFYICSKEAGACYSSIVDRSILLLLHQQVFKSSSSLSLSLSPSSISSLSLSTAVYIATLPLSSAFLPPNIFCESLSLSHVSSRCFLFTHTLGRE